MTQFYFTQTEFELTVNKHQMQKTEISKSMKKSRRFGNCGSTSGRFNGRR